MKSKTIFTNPTIEGITKQINEYFCSNNHCKVTSTGTIRNDKTGITFDGYKVIRCRGGFEFVKK